jgi:hypothetical protein
MPTAYQQKVYEANTVTPAMLDEAYAEAERTLAAYVTAEEVRPGQWLCPRGRVYRAMDIANRQPREKWAALQVEIARLSAVCDKRHDAWVAAERHYTNLCRRAHVEPQPPKSDACTCEGCQLYNETVEYLARKAIA